MITNNTQQVVPETTNIIIGHEVIYNNVHVYVEQALPVTPLGLLYRYDNLAISLCCQIKPVYDSVVTDGQRNNWNSTSDLHLNFFVKYPLTRGEPSPS